ncbi:MAG: response regulator [Chitinophagales bacterium]|nr:response regulator [Chitinophagales bacterium]MDW8427920.1 response regulator [Chitinophagales bacterium]
MRVKSARRPLRALVVEDNAINQRLLHDLLVLEKIQCVLVSSGPEAIEAIRQQHFDVVLMDLQMPGMDGLEVSRLMREELGEQCPPIIAVTAYASEEDRQRCLQDYRLNGFLSKPFYRQQLMAEIRRVCR